MVLSWLRKLSSGEGGRDAIFASYRRHYDAALRRRIEPFSMGLFGALTSRYALRRVRQADIVHWVEITPFVMMGEAEGVESLAYYLVTQEVRGHVDLSLLKSKINSAIGNCDNQAAEDSYKLLVSSLPFVETSKIRWLEWLEKPIAEQLLSDAAAEMEAK